jgi:RNA polymerase sigma-70 factor, ECF subfamily
MDTDRPDAIDEPTFAAIWSEYATAVTARLRALGVGPDAQDLSQDVFLAAWVKRDQYDPARGPVIAWLYARARTVADMYFRALSRRPSIVEFPDGYEAADDTDVAAQVCDQIEATAALERVPARDRELLARRYLADQPVTQVADALDMPAGTVKSRCHKALAALRTAVNVVTPIAPRTPQPTPDPQPATATTARSTTVAAPDRPRPAHPVRPGRPRRHLHGHRCRVAAARPAGTPHPPHRATTRRPHTVLRPARGRTSQRTVRADTAAPDPLRRRVRPQHRPDAAVPAGHLRRPQGGNPMTPQHMFDDRPIPSGVGWALGVLLFVCCVGWFAAALLRSIRLHPVGTYDWRPPAPLRRLADGVCWLWWRLAERRGRHRYVRGDRVAVSFTPGCAPVGPAVFAPESLEPGDDSPIGGESEGTEPEPVEEPLPAATWPVPVLLPQPNPDPVAAVLFEATGPYPVLGGEVLHSGMTGAIPRIADEIWAGAR